MRVRLRHTFALFGCLSFIFLLTLRISFYGHGTQGTQEDYFDDKTTDIAVYSSTKISPRIKSERMGCIYYKKCKKVLPFKMFKYPLNVDMRALVKDYKLKGSVGIDPVFVYPHKAVVEPQCKCNCRSKSESSKTSKDYLLFLVKSAPGNWKRRAAIREMWGNENLNQTSNLKYRLRTVFLIGETNDTDISRSISLEILSFKDIVKLNYVDTYYNNTLKTIGGLNWAVEHCNDAKFLMFVDDDFYVNPVLLMKHLASITEADVKTLFLGKIWYDVPQRGALKWAIPVSVYPYDKYPPFISAGCMIMSMEFAIDLHIAIQYTYKFKFDDVFLAIVVYKLGVTPQHSDFIRISERTDYRKTKDFHKVIASHQYGDIDHLRNAWTNFTNTKYL